MNRLLRTSVAALAAASSAVVFAASPAGASSAGRAAPTSASARGQVGDAPNNSASSVFAGYQTTGASTSVSTMFKIPTLTGCTSGTNQGIAPGVQVFNTGDFSAAQIFAYCNGTTPAYLADLIVDGQESDWALNLNPGDKMSTSITESTTSTSVKVNDMTTHQSASLTVSVGDSMTGASVGVGPVFFGGVLAGPPMFSKVTFTMSKVNGAALNTLSPTAFDRFNGTQRQISTSPLTAVFANKFVHS